MVARQGRYTDRLSDTLILLAHFARPFEMHVLIVLLARLSPKERPSHFPVGLVLQLLLEGE